MFLSLLEVLEGWTVLRGEGGREGDGWSEGEREREEIIKLDIHYSTRATKN